jgi:hypothetical protein
MEYINDRGVFDDVPVQQIMSDFWARYPSLMSASRQPLVRFADEAVAAVLGENAGLEDAAIGSITCRRLRNQ